MATPIEDLLQTIRILRSPDGCPWDRKQSLTDAGRYLLDEAGELVDATLEGDHAHVAEELGDLLFMVCFCAEILSGEYDTDFQRIAALGNEKLIRRHPHVFGEVGAATDSAESQVRWQEIKDDEKRARGIEPDRVSLLHDLPSTAAPLHVAYTCQKDAADVGFDWPDIGGVWAKVAEEEEEVRRASADGDRPAIEHEIGDLLFSVVNLARHLKVQPDQALRRANRRFVDRFHLVEDDFGNSARAMRVAPLDELEASWQRAKRVLRQSADESTD